MPREVSAGEVVAAVVTLATEHPDRTVWIGVDGRGASGKSTLAAGIAASEPRCTVVHVDDFAGPQLTEWDWDRFREQVLDPLRAGTTARYQRWDWDRDEGAEWHLVEPGRVLVIEGVSATRDEVDAPWDLRIWVDAPLDVRVQRALERDGEAMRPMWLERWMPSEEAYIATQRRPDLRADLLVIGTE